MRELTWYAVEEMIEVKLDPIRQQIKSLRERVREIEEDDLAGKVDSLEGDLEDLDSQVSSLRTDIMYLQSSGVSVSNLRTYSNGTAGSRKLPSLSGLMTVMFHRLLVEPMNRISIALPSMQSHGTRRN